MLTAIAWQALEKHAHIFYLEALPTFQKDMGYLPIKCIIFEVAREPAASS